MESKPTILGAGITGLSAGFDTNRKIYEAKEVPGGICSSYYMNLEGERDYQRVNKETYRFENGGGHWIFGADKQVLEFINRLSPVKSYERTSAVFFPDQHLYVPYPIQNHLSYLPKDIAKKSLDEIVKADHSKDVSLFSEWLELHFGKTLCELFFFPFHELYTAGLFTKIEPQDRYKSPVDKEQVVGGFKGESAPVGYNARFVYPEKGLDDLMRKMARQCRINYHKEVVKIDLRKREILFMDGTAAKYGKLISTLPLNKVVKLSRIRVEGHEPPYTSVLVINIGAKKGRKCPMHHWLYIPKSKCGFHRVGFYSNVDTSFLPESSRMRNDRVSIYVEKSYLPEQKPDYREMERIGAGIVDELKSWEFIKEAEVVDPTWIEVAYTWSYPRSAWKGNAVKTLKQNNIYQIGRYGLWEFQGIAKSIKDGLGIVRFTST